MRARRLAVLLLAASLLTACSSKPEDPKTTLIDSTAGLKAGNYAFTAVMTGTKEDGVADAPSHRATMNEVQNYLPGLNSFEMMYDGSYEYHRSRVDATWAAAQQQEMQGIGGATGAKPLTPAASGGDGAEVSWTRVDLSKASTRYRGSLLTLDHPDLTGAVDLLTSGVRSATANGRTITGMLATHDLPFVGRAFNPVYHQSDAQPQIPFTATLDKQGRLIKLVLDLPESQDPHVEPGKWILDITEYGSAPQPVAPTDFVPVPDEQYQFM
jgi:hypothetical protein